MSITHSRPAIALEAAERIVRAAVADAGGRRLAIAVAVCDWGGGLVAFARMDGVTPGIGTLAADRAGTAATSSETTREIGEQEARGRPRAGPAMIASPGGLPILFAGRIVGAIGVAGARPEEDEDIAAMALGALPDRVGQP